MSDPQSEPAPGVTNVVDRIPRPGQTEALEQAIRAMIAQAIHFPGHHGVTVDRPAPPAQPAFRIVYRFDTAEHMQAWLQSDTYRRLAAVADALTEGHADQHLVAGIETWFTPPGARAPSRLRVTLMSWVGIAPLTYLYGRLITLLLPHLGYGFERAGLLAACVVPTMAYVVGPSLTRICRPWLYPKTKTPPKA